MTNTRPSQNPNPYVLPYRLNSPSGSRIDSKSKLIRYLAGQIDLSTFDFQLGRHVQGTAMYNHHQLSSGVHPQSSANSSHHHRSSPASAGLKRSIDNVSSAPPPLIKHPFEYRLRYHRTWHYCLLAIPPIQSMSAHCPLYLLLCGMRLFLYAMCFALRPFRLRLFGSLFN